MFNSSKVAVQQLLNFLYTLLKSKGYNDIKTIDYSSTNNCDYEISIPNNEYLLKFAYKKVKKINKFNSKVRVSIIKFENFENIPVFELEDPKLIDYLNQLVKRKAYFDKISKK